MEKPSGLKECPRCGLRNRNGAYQCDFCGWDFKAASDDWMGKVDTLERIGKEIDSPALDKQTTTKIELAIKKPQDIPVKERKPESTVEADLFHSQQHDENNDADVIAQSAVFVGAYEQETAIEHEPAQELVPDEREAPEETKVNAKEENPVREEVERVFTYPRPVIAATALITIGSGVYLGTLFLAVTQNMGKVVGWGLTIVGALFLVAGVGILYNRHLRSTEEKDEDVVLLCPECHEVVSDKDKNCPSCGAMFKDLLAKE